MFHDGNGLMGVIRKCWYKTLHAQVEQGEYL